MCLWGLAAAVAIAYAPSLIEFSRRLWNADHYSFFPIYLAALVFIGYRRCVEDGPFSPSFTTGTAAKWILPAVLLALSVWLRRPWLAGVSFVLSIRAFLFVAGGASLFGSVRLIWWALWICIPPPFNLDLELIVRMQRFASSSASVILDYFGFRHLLTGVLLNFPERSFEVEEACSGVHSLYASLAGVAIYSILLRRTLMRTGLLMAAGVFWVLVMNVGRILLVVVAELRYRVPLGEGLAHELAGYVIFALVVAMVISTDRLLVFLLPERTSFGHKRQPRPSLVGHLLSRKVAAGTFTIAAATVFAALLGWRMLRPAEENPQLRVSGTRLNLTDKTLASEILGWKQKSFEVVERSPGDINGEASYVWVFEQNGLECRVAVDGPFGLWHDLGYCYAARGWQLNEARDLRLRIPGNTFMASELSMEDKTGQHGHVVFAAFAADGTNIAPPPIRLGATSGPRLQNGLTSLLEPRQKQASGPVFCLQVYSTVALGFSDDEKAQHRELLERVVLMLRDELSERVTREKAR